jgi:hypothetical protein
MGGATTVEVDDDPRLAFVYQEALRGLLQQQAAVESLHNRAGTLIFAASFASSLLGSRALVAGVALWNWIAIGLLFMIGGLAVLILWPYYNLSFRFDAGELLDRYVEGAQPSSMSEIHRSLALRCKSDWASNGRIVRRMREAFQAALVLLMLLILAWFFSIARVPI